MRLFRTALLSLALVGGGGCATAVLTGADQGGYDAGAAGRQQTRADAEISAAVNRALVRDGRVPAMAIRVRTDYGRVTLSGRVPDRDAAARAVRIAAGVPGVKAVADRLVVGR